MKFWSLRIKIPKPIGILLTEWYTQVHINFKIVKNRSKILPITNSTYTGPPIRIISMWFK